MNSFARTVCAAGTRLGWRLRRLAGWTIAVGGLLLALLWLLLAGADLEAQSASAVPIASPSPVLTTYGTIAVGAPVRVCLITAIGSPCSTAGVQLYSDANLSQILPDPTATNAQGTYSFFINSSQYTLPQLFMVEITSAPGSTYTYYFQAVSGTGGGFLPPNARGALNNGGTGDLAWVPPFAVDVTQAPYNAACDGHTDDSAAIQAALDNNAAVYIPSNASGTKHCEIPEGLTLCSSNNKFAFNALYGNAQVLDYGGTGNAIQTIGNCYFWIVSGVRVELSTGSGTPTAFNFSHDDGGTISNSMDVADNIAYGSYTSIEMNTEGFSTVSSFSGDGNLVLSGSYQNSIIGSVLAGNLNDSGATFVSITSSSIGSSGGGHTITGGGDVNISSTRLIGTTTITGPAQLTTTGTTMDALTLSGSGIMLNGDAELFGVTGPPVTGSFSGFFSTTDINGVPYIYENGHLIPASPSGSQQFNDNGSFGGTATVIDVLPYTASGPGATDLAAAFAAAATVCEATASCNTVTGVSLPCPTGSYNWTRLTLTQPINVVGTKNCLYAQPNGFVGPWLDIERSTGPTGGMTLTNVTAQTQPNNDWIDYRADDQSISPLNLVNSSNNIYGNVSCNAGLGYGIVADAGLASQNLKLNLTNVGIGADYYALKSNWSYFDNWDNVRVLACNGFLAMAEGVATNVYSNVTHNSWVGGGEELQAPPWISSATWQSGAIMQLPTRTTNYIYTAQNTGLSGTTMPTDCGTLNCTTTDGGITWKATKFTPHIWQPQTTYPAGACALNVDTTAASNDPLLGVWCTTAGGTSGTAVPAWATTGSISDGSITDWAYHSTPVFGSGATEIMACHNCDFEASPSGTSVVLLGAGSPLILEDGSIVSSYGGDGILVESGANLEMDKGVYLSSNVSGATGIELENNAGGLSLDHVVLVGDGGDAIKMDGANCITGFGLFIGILKGTKFSGWTTDIAAPVGCIAEEHDNHQGLNSGNNGFVDSVPNPFSPYGTPTWTSGGNMTWALAGSSTGTVSVTATHNTTSTLVLTGAIPNGLYQFNVLQDSTGTGTTTLDLGTGCTAWYLYNGSAYATASSLSVTPTANAGNVLSIRVDNAGACWVNAQSGVTGVTSINSATGPFNFTFSAGAGSCLGTTCNFTGSGAGGGSVSDFIASSASWPGWLTPNVATSTTTPTLSVTATTGETANEFLATPNGSTGAVGLRAIVNADLPSTLTGITIDGVTPTTMSYVDPTSSIQTQLNGKQASGSYQPALSLLKGTYIDGDFCSYTSAGTLLNCNSTGAGPTVQTNGTNNHSQTALNFLTSLANTAGLVVTPSNPSAGGERMEVSGTYSGTLTSSQVTTALTYTPANCTAGSSAGDCPVLNGSAQIATAELPQATPSAYGTMEGTTTTANQVAVSTTTAGKLAFIDYPAPFMVPAANCVGGQPGSAWSTTLAASCRAGTYNLGGNLPFADGGTGQFEIAIPADWDSSANSYARLDFTTGANTSGTIIFQIQLSCYTTSNAETDDQPFETAQVFSTVTAGTANYANSVTLTLNSTSLTGCAAAGGMIVKVTRNTDTATAVVPVSKAIITLPRKLVLQAE